MGQPTIKDVAKIAGVSISTVSRVMNKSKPVSPEAQKKVEDAIDKLGFKPNELARSLVMKKSNSIGILIKDIGIDYMAQMVRGAEEIGRMYKYDILLTSSYGDLELEKKAVDFLYRKQVEGIILVTEKIDPEIIVKIRDYQIPYMLLDRYYQSKEVHTVAIDYQSAMKEMAEYVANLGNKKIAYLYGSNSYEFAQEKLTGYEEAMTGHGLSTYPIMAGDTTTEAGYRAMKKLFEEKKDLVDDLDCLLCQSDQLAFGVLSYCYDNDINVPKDLQVTGVGGSHFTQIIRPKLTTIQEPYYDMGAVAMRMLTKILQNKEEMKEPIRLPVQILAGQSTAKR
ncbi:LacI family DNA-binding transcriptional regulator [Kallipyga gabonensis]|uniref:LacI family DNA-binding transcriptional regulator n=1 Tax=Kallipyga gabonensis TaxID=1686287 RepID=UPI0006B4CE1C|nr:LacI family DNA-binding transcriptional regulator [Kallipyga gabonensis]